MKSSKKTPRCVDVYNKIFEKIESGEFSIESRLPGELELAKSMEVSRSTLRQALELLQEDGIIKSIQGKGNFVVRDGIKAEKGIEILENPIYSIISEIDDIEFEFRIEPGTDYTVKIFERKTPVVIFSDRWFKNKNEIVGYTISIIPVETILEAHLDLAEHDKFLEYINKDIYKIIKYSSLKISFSEIGNISSAKYKLCKDNRCYLLVETLYDKNGSPIIYNKHYIPIEDNEIILYRKP